MRRVFYDFDWKFKILEYIGPSLKKTPDNQTSPASVWFDFEREKNITIPDESWVRMQIKFFDLEQTD